MIYLIVGAIIGLPLGWWLACKIKARWLDILVGVGIVAFVALVAAGALW